MIKIDESRTNNLNEFSIKLLKSHYTRPNETIQQAFARASECFSDNNEELAQRLYDYVSKGWFMFSSPVLSNAINKGDKVKGLPISCFLSYVENSIKGLCDHTSELRWLSVKGGGIGGHWDDIESMSKKTPGPIGFLHTVDADMTAYRQGSTRRGSYASYLDISHPDIIEYIKMRLPTGDINRKNLNLHHGVNITDNFLNAVDQNLDWDLIDPRDKEIKSTLSARDLWETLLVVRFRTGEPFLNFIDEANRRLPESFKKEGLKIKGSNLCNEIHLVTDRNRSAVCCLSSVNLSKYDEWKDTSMIEDLIEMLDNVLQFFIDNAPKKELKKAIKSAIEERSLGLGAMGFHDYLQSKNIPWESSIAISTNRKIFKTIKDSAVIATKSLYERKGKCLFSFDNRRNAHLLAIAPNANSSIILNTSPSIEPRSSNAYTHKTRVGSYIVKNEYLDKVISKKYNTYKKLNSEVSTKKYYDSNGKLIPNKGTLLPLNSKDIYKKISDSKIIHKVYYKGIRKFIKLFSLKLSYSFTEVQTNYKKLSHKEFQENIWKRIIADNGSIQNIDIFTKEEKNIFKTAFELDQRWVVNMAKSRQEYICQGQSVNLFFPSGTDKEYLNKVHRLAFTKTEDNFRPLKGLYYLRTESSRKTENISISVQRDALKDGVNEVCISCEG